MSEGILYEPRALWSMRSIGAADTRVQFPREDLFNGTRHPITITRIAFTLPSSVFKEATPVVNPIFEQEQPNPLSVANGLHFKISAPFRQHYMRFPICAGGSAPRSTPSMRDTPTPYSSGLFGVNHLKLDKPLVLPREGSLELDLGGLNTPVIDGVLAANLQAGLNFSMNFQHAGGLFAGSTRHIAPTLLVPIVAPVDLSEFGATPALPPGADAVATFSSLPVAVFPPEDRFDARQYRQQQAARAGSEVLKSISIMFEQIDYDDAIQASTTVSIPGTPIVPLGNQIVSRIRTVDGGSGQWWWRPGAPVGLVFDTITEANVYPLPYPITLGPGEQLEVEAEFDRVIAGAGASVVGISFNGYAAIEG